MKGKHKELCHCCQPDKDGNPIPDPKCTDCGGDGTVWVENGMPADEYADIIERQSMQASQRK